MTPDDVMRVIRYEVDAFTQEVPSRDGLLGVPWSQERMAQEISALREALSEPKLVPVEIADDPRARETRMLWVVTRPDSNGYVLVFDPVGPRFGLAVTGHSGPPQTVAVWGDLVTTYAAR
ncbi:MAG TPA: hypothetical protein VNO75_06965 [Gemmatimonadaceae bacterium]|nr:hypothetical protein [Gemmatimonadaceae bacterium]